MKAPLRLIAALAVILMAGLSLTAAAEPTPYTATLPYAHPRHNYRVDYPADWLPLDREGVALYIESAKSGTLPAELSMLNSSPEAGQMLENVMPQIEQLDIVLFISSLGDGSNFNVAVSPFSPTPDFALVMKELPDALRPQYEGMFPGMEFEQALASKMGGMDALRFDYHFISDGRVHQQIQYFLFHKDQQYVLTFTWVDPAPEGLEQRESLMASTAASFVPAP